MGGYRGQVIERVDVSEPASISTGIAARYASAVYELAKDDKAVKTLEGDIDTLSAALADSADLNALIQSPIYSREEQAAAITAVAQKAGLSGLMTNTLALMADKRRLFVVPQLLQSLRAIIAEDKFPQLATIDGDQPRLRPVSPVRTDEFVVYVANLRFYHKTREIEANPKVELCYMDQGHNPMEVPLIGEGGCC